jgi:hypothetical protein
VCQKEGRFAENDKSKSGLALGKKWSKENDTVMPIPLLTTKEAVTFFNQQSRYHFSCEAALRCGIFFFIFRMASSHLNVLVLSGYGR